MSGEVSTAAARKRHASTRRRSPSSDRTSDGNGAKSTRLTLIGVKVDPALCREIDAYAEAHGITRSRAAGEYLATAREAFRERDGIPAGRAEELLEAFEGVRAVLELLGPPTFGLMRLLAHWATQGDRVRFSEDELLAELRAVGADEWEQAVADAERELHEARREPRTTERS
jgi:hypothetical protein